MFNYFRQPPLATNPCWWLPLVLSANSKYVKSYNRLYNSFKSERIILPLNVKNLDYVQNYFEIVGLLIFRNRLCHIFLVVRQLLSLKYVHSNSRRNSFHFDFLWLLRFYAVRYLPFFDLNCL
jgi:hypothetical protein